MRLVLITVVASSLLARFACLPYGKPIKNNISQVALKILSMMDGKCQMYNYTNRITRPGCEPVQVKNKFCGGRCPSRYFPGYTYCTACMPGKLVTKKIVFNCPKDPVKKVRHRRIQIVQHCECRRFACKK